MPPYASRKAKLIAAAAAAVALAVPAGASAADQPQAASGCTISDQPFTQPFTPWGDGADYVPAPGGTFEQGIGDATVTGDASAVPAVDPLTGTAGTAIQLNPGASLTTAPMCVDRTYSTYRFFAQMSGSRQVQDGQQVTSGDTQTDGTRPRLSAEVIHLDLPGAPATQAVARADARVGDWILVRPIRTRVGATDPGTGQPTLVAFRFTAPDSGATFLIDDVYVDPYSRR